jgi:hypothetical protein
VIISIISAFRSDPRADVRDLPPRASRTVPVWFDSQPPAVTFRLGNITANQWRKRKCPGVSRWSGDDTLSQ